MSVDGVPVNAGGFPEDLDGRAFGFRWTFGGSNLDRLTIDFRSLEGRWMGVGWQLERLRWGGLHAPAPHQDDSPPGAPD